VVARPLGLGKDARVECACVCSQKVGYRSKEVVKCFQNPYHQVCQLSLSIMEARDFKEIGTIVLHILWDSVRRHFKHSGLRPMSSYDALSLQGILS
jgi:hypothetical protein